MSLCSLLEQIMRAKLHCVQLFSFTFLMACLLCSHNISFHSKYIRIWIKGKPKNHAVME